MRTGRKECKGGVSEQRERKEESTLVQKGGERESFTKLSLIVLLLS